MNLASTSLSAVHEEAATWFARVRGGDCNERDWLSFCAWLDVDQSHRQAYADLEDMSLGLEALPTVQTAKPDSLVAFPQRRAPPRQSPALAWAGGAAIAAAVALVILPATLLATPTESYATAIGQSRTVTLADGSKIVLNSGTRITLGLSPRERRVTLDEGEAAFDVTHNADRPFRIAAGDDKVVVLGTEFDLLRHDGALKVTVRRGLVSVITAESPGGTAVLVPAGQQLSLPAGVTRPIIKDVDPSQAFAWRSRQLVYRDVRLAEVAADMSRYVAKPIRVDQPAADLRVTAVINLDDEAAMVRGLQAFLPIRAEFRSGDVQLTAAR